MPARKRSTVLVLVAVAALAVGVWRCRSGDEPAEKAAQTRQPVPRAPLHFRDGKWVRLDEGELRRVLHELATRKPGLIRVSGTVREDESGEPIAGAEVVFAGPDGEASVTADGAGEYTIEVQPGLYRGFARADGYVAVGMPRFERLPSQPAADTVGMPRGELAPVLAVFRDQRGVDMHLHGSATVTGTVYDTSGRPISGALVTGFRTAGPALILGTDMVETDLDGSFQLEVAAGYVQLDASHADFAGLSPTTRFGFVLAPGETERRDLTLIAGCIVEGNVVDDRGRPVGEGSLEIDIGGAPPNDFAPVGRIDAGGRFRLARVDEGSFRLRAWPWKSPHTAPQEVSCGDGDRYDLTLVVPDAEPELEGSLWTVEGEPAAGAYVDIHPLSPGGMAQQERVDAYGEWAVYALPPGDYQVTAYVSGAGAAVRTVTVPARGVRMTLSGTGTIAGTTRGLDQGSFTFQLVRCLLRADDGSMARFDPLSMPETRRIVSVDGGSFEIDELPACPLEAFIRQGRRTMRVEVNVEPDRAVPLELDLREAERVVAFGVVTSEDGTPRGGVSVSRLPGPGAPRDAYAFTTTDEEGRYEIDAFTGDRLLFRGADGNAVVELAWDGDERRRMDVSLSEY